MNKKYIIRKNEEIEKIIANNEKSVSKFFVLYHINNTLGYNRFCVSVSKKLGKAYKRNLLKRRVKDILMKRTFQPNNSKKSKTSGYFSRKGSNVIKSRRAKGRKELAK